MATPKKTRSASAPKTREPTSVRAPARSLASSAWPDGFGETPADEEGFRRGFPHLRTLVPGNTRDVVATTQAALGAADPVLDFVWPRDVAERFVRGMGGGDATVAGPMGAVGPLVKSAMARPGSARDWRVGDFLFLLEAEHGPDAVVDAVLSVLEKGGALLAGRGYGPHIVFTAGYPLRRSQRAAEHFARLEAIRARVDKGKPAPHPDWIKNIDAVLDGDSAFASFGWLLRCYGFVADGAALADKLLAAPGEFLPDVRQAYLGGPRVIAYYEKRLDELPPGPLGRRLFHQLAPCKRSIVTPLMQRLARRDDTRALATAWLG